MLTPLNNVSFMSAHPNFGSKKATNKVKFTGTQQMTELPKNFTAAQLAGMVQVLNGQKPIALNSPAVVSIAPKAAEPQNFTRVRAQHILVDSEEKAIQIMENILANNTTFEDAALIHSSCPSGNEGGDLGFFERGAMVKPFEEAAFKSNIGELVGPVKTDFGYHIIKTTAKE